MTYPLARALWIAGAVLGVSLLGVVARADAGTRRFAAVAVWAAAGLVFVISGQKNAQPQGQITLLFLAVALAAQVRAARSLR